MSCSNTSKKIITDPSDNRYRDENGNYYQEYKNTVNAWDNIVYTNINYDFSGGLGMLLDELQNSLSGTDFTKSYTRELLKPVNNKIEGVVTLRSNWYNKVMIPTTNGQDEKNFGCFFIQDGDEGVFILYPNCAIPYVEYGDRVKLEVISMARSYGENFIVAHKNLSVISKNNPIYYITPNTALEDISPLKSLRNSFINKVVRITGYVSIPNQDDFDRYGEFALISDNGISYGVSQSLTLKDRKYKINVDERLEITGPVINSFGVKVCLSDEGQVVRK